MVMVVFFFKIEVLMKSLVLMIHGGINIEKNSVANQDESDGQNVCWNLAGIHSIGHNLHPALKSCHLET